MEPSRRGRRGARVEAWKKYVARRVQRLLTSYFAAPANLPEPTPFAPVLEEVPEEQERPDVELANSDAPGARRRDRADAILLLEPATTGSRRDPPRVIRVSPRTACEPSTRSSALPTARSAPTRPRSRPEMKTKTKSKTKAKRPPPRSSVPRRGAAEARPARRSPQRAALCGRSFHLALLQAHAAGCAPSRRRRRAVPHPDPTRRRRARARSRSTASRSTSTSDAASPLGGARSPARRPLAAAHHARARGATNATLRRSATGAAQRGVGAPSATAGATLAPARSAGPCRRRRRSGASLRGARERRESRGARVCAAEGDRRGIGWCARARLRVQRRHIASGTAARGFDGGVGVVPRHGAGRRTAERRSAFVRGTAAETWASEKNVEARRDGASAWAPTMVRARSRRRCSHSGAAFTCAARRVSAARYSRCAVADAAAAPSTRPFAI